MARIRVVTDSACDLSAALAAEQGSPSSRSPSGSAPRSSSTGPHCPPTTSGPVAPPARCSPRRRHPRRAPSSRPSWPRPTTGTTACCASTSPPRCRPPTRPRWPRPRRWATGFRSGTVDSRSLTMGLGLMVLDVADLAAGGATLDELADRVERPHSRTQVFGVVDTLEHLEKGGRIGGARALLGSLLSIKPVVTLVDGVSKRSRSSAHVAVRCATWPTRPKLAAHQPPGGVQRGRERHRRLPDHARRREDRTSDGGGRPRTGGRYSHRSRHHRDLHRVTGTEPSERRHRPGRPRRADYPRTMDPQPESPATRLPGSGAISDLPTRGTDLVDTLVELLGTRPSDR